MSRIKYGIAVVVLISVLIGLLVVLFTHVPFTVFAGVFGGLALAVLLAWAIEVVFPDLHD